MRVLLVNSNRYKLPVPTMPFGLCCVAAALENAGHHIHTLDLCFSKNCKRDISNTVSEFLPDIIGISIRNIDTAQQYKTFFLLDQVKDEVTLPIKKEFSGPIVIGGSAVGINGAEMLAFFDLEYAIRGDGEAAMVEFVKRIENKQPLHGLRGLVIRKNGKIIEENSPMSIIDMDSIPPFKHYRYIDLKTYRRYIAPIQIQTKRGCELDCIYCSYKIIEGQEFRLRHPQRIADEIETVVKDTGINHFEFTDSVFNIPLDFAKSVLRAINAKKLDLEIQVMGLNPGAVDEELVELMKESNIKEVQIGVESCCDAILKNLGKKYKKVDIVRCAEILHKAGVPAIWSLMMGSPGETEETLRETFDTIIRCASKWDYVLVLYAIRVYKGAPLSIRMLQENPDCTKDNFLQPVFFSPQKISLETIRVSCKRMALQYPNILLANEVQRMPFIILKIQTLLMKIFAPKKPWWKFFILLTKTQKIVGYTALKRLLFKYKNRKILKNLHF